MSIGTFPLPTGLPAVNNNITAGHVARGVRNEENNGRLIFINVRHSAHGNKAGQPIHKLLRMVMKHPGGGNSVHLHSFRRPIRCQVFGESYETMLHDRVRHRFYGLSVLWRSFFLIDALIRRDDAQVRSNINDDSFSAPGHPLSEYLGTEECSGKTNGNIVMPDVFGKLFETRPGDLAGLTRNLWIVCRVIDERVNMAESGFELFFHRLHALLPSDISSHPKSRHPKIFCYVSGFFFCS